MEGTFGFSSGRGSSTSTWSPWQPQGQNLSGFQNYLSGFFNPTTTERRFMGYEPIMGTDGSRGDVVTGQRPIYDDVQVANPNSALSNPQQFIAGFTQPQMQGQQSALNFAQGSGANMAQQAQNAYGFGLNAMDLNQNPYFGSALNAALRPITQNFQENVLPGIGHGATAAGQYGSSRHGVAQALANRDYMNTIGDTAGVMASNAYGQGLNTMLGTLGQSGNVANMGLLPSSIMQDVGARQQALNQQRLNAPFSLLSTYQSLIGDPITGSETTKSRESKSGFSLGF